MHKRDNGPYLGFTTGKDPVPVHYFDRKRNRDREKHLILLGPNGSGKDTTIIAPNMAQLRRSVFCVDIKGEQAALTARARSKFSKIVCINPFGLLTDTHPHLKSHGFDPIKHKDFDPSKPTFNSIAEGYGDFLIQIDGVETFFPISARSLMASLTMWERMTSSTPSLANVRRMLGEYYGMQNDKAVGLLKTLMDMSHRGYLPMTNKINRFLYPNNETRGVISTALAQCAFLDDPRIVEDMQNAKPLDFADLKHGNELITVYFILPADKLQGTYASYMRLVIGTALRDLMKSGPGDGPRPLLVINEAAQLGSLDVLSAAMGIARGYGFTIMTVWQSLGQIRNNFGKNAETLIGARGVLSAFAPQDWETAEYLSKLLGNRTELVTSYNAAPGRPQSSSHETPQSFPLLRPEDLMRLPANRMLNFMEPVEWPFFTDTPGYWQTPWASCFEFQPLLPRRAAKAAARSDSPAAESQIAR